jgi:hypothetical protein
LENLNTAFFSFFILEIIIKITGRGIKNYLIDKFNWFDSFIILLSGIDIVLANTISSKLILINKLKYSLKFGKWGNHSLSCFEAIESYASGSQLEELSRNAGGADHDSERHFEYYGTLSCFHFYIHAYWNGALLAESICE